MSRLLFHALAALGSLIIVLLLLGSSVLPGRVLSTAGLEQTLPWAAHSTAEERALPQMNIDGVVEQLAYGSFIDETLRQGEIPWWSPYMYCGWPLVALGRTEALYPVTWLSVLLGSWFDRGVKIGLHLFVAALGALLWIRATGASRSAALLAGGVFMLNGMFLTRHGHPAFVATGCWLPWILLGVEWVGGRRRAQGIALIGVATALAVLAGHPSVYVYGAYFIGFYSLERIWRASIRGSDWRGAVTTAACITGGALIGVALAGTQLLATVELSDLSHRSVRSPVSLMQTLPHWLHLVRFFAPDALGNPIDGNYWSPSNTSYTAGSFYAGIAPLILAVVGAFRGPRGAAVGIFAVLALCAIFVPYVFELAYYLPGFQFSRIDRLSIGVFLAVAPLSAWGFDALRGLRGPLGEPPLPQRKIMWILVGALFTGLAGAAAAAELPKLVAEGRLALAALDVEAVSGAAWRGLLLWLVIVGLLGLAQMARWQAWATAGVLVVTILELIGHGRHFVVARDAEQMFRETPATRFLRDAEGPFRVAKYDPSLAAERQKKSPLRLFPANTPTAYRIEDIHGYSSLRTHDLDFLLEPLDPASVRNPWRVAPLQRVETLSTPLLDLLQVKYLLSTATLEVAGLEPVHSGDIYIYENRDVLPRASFHTDWVVVPDRNEAAQKLLRGLVDPRQTVVVDRTPALAREPSAPTPSGSVELISYEASEVRLRKRGASAGLVLLLDAWYPGWTGRVDGEPVSVLRANVMFRAVAVPEGEHVVVFEYRPTYLGAATWLAGAGILSLVLVLSLAVRVRLNPRGGTEL